MMQMLEKVQRVSGVTADLQHEIDQFLYAEAALLDARAYNEWFTLMAEDLHYYMPVRVNRRPTDPRGEFYGPNELAHYDETRASLWRRVKRLNTGQVIAEDPPSVTRHNVFNIRITHISSSGEHEVRCLFTLHRSRLERQHDTFNGGRIDVLRRADNPFGWEIARRTIHLDHTLVQSNNLAVLF